MSEQLQFFPAPARTPPTPPDPDRTTLWRNGLKILRGIVSSIAPACADGKLRRFMGGLSDASGHRHIELLALIERCRDAKPDEPIAWLWAGARALGASGPSDDPWGLRSWFAAEARAWSIEAYEEIMSATGIPATWRGSLAMLQQWSDAGFRPDSVAEVLAAAPAAHDSKPGRVTSLSFYDAVVRRRAVWWSERKLEWVRGSP